MSLHGFLVLSVALTVRNVGTQTVRCGEFSCAELACETHIIGGAWRCGSVGEKVFLEV
jgi:hypothetical protein